MISPPSDNTAMFAEFDKALGSDTPTIPGQTAGPSRGDQIRAIMHPPVQKSVGENYMDNVMPAANDVNDLVSGFTGGALDTGAKKGNIGTAVDKFKKGDIAGGAEDATLGVASDAVKAIFAPIAAPIQSLIAAHASTADPSNPVPGESGMNTPEAIAARKQISDWMEAHPQIAKTLGDVFNVGGAALGSSALDTTVSDAALAAKNAVKGTVDTVKGAASDAKNAVIHTGTPTPGEELESINNMITPKPTAGQAKIAMDEGRLYKGNDATLFKAGTADRVAATAQQANSARTIQRLIPGAAKMDEPTLYGALDEEVSKVAQKLEPTMKATPISEETQASINTEWKQVKQLQKDTSDGTKDSDAIIKKSQANFEAILGKVKPGKVNDIIARARAGQIDDAEFTRQMTERGQQIDSSNMDDLWKAAKDYDKSVPKNVKNATDLSPEKLQLQKTLWLQNRAVIRKALTDSTNGLGKAAQKAFSDMTDMYEAQNGIMTKAEIVQEGAPSKINQAVDTIKKHPYISAFGAYEAMKHTIPGGSALPGF